MKRREIDSGGSRVEKQADDLTYAFLLRCWLEPGAGPDEGTAWRFSVTSMDKKRVKKGFADLDGLVRYLRSSLEGQK